MGCGTYLESEKLRTICTSKYSGEFLITRHRGFIHLLMPFHRCNVAVEPSSEGTAHWPFVHRYVPASGHRFSVALMCTQPPKSRLFSRGKEGQSVTDTPFTTCKEKANMCRTFAAQNCVCPCMQTFTHVHFMLF